MSLPSKDQVNEEAKRLATEHWAYIESVLMKDLEMTGKMYRDAMIHGFKHGIEYLTENSEKT
jgi:hypothetical protein